MTRQEKIDRIVMLIEDIEGVKILDSHYENFAEEELDEIIEWYEYLLEK